MSLAQTAGDFRLFGGGKVLDCLGKIN